MLVGDSDHVRNIEAANKVGQSLEESQRFYDKWGPTYEQVRFFWIDLFLDLNLSLIWS